MSKEKSTTWIPSSGLYGWSPESENFRNCVNLQDYSTTNLKSETFSPKPSEYSIFHPEVKKISQDFLRPYASTNLTRQREKSETANKKKGCDKFKTHIFKSDNPDSPEDHLVNIRKRTSEKRPFSKKGQGISKSDSEKQASVTATSRKLDTQMPLNNSKIPKNPGSSNPTAFIDNLHTKKRSSDLKHHQNPHHRDEKYEKIKAMKRDFKNRSSRNINSSDKNNYWSRIMKNYFDDLLSKLVIYLSTFSDLLCYCMVITVSYLGKVIPFLFRLLSIIILTGFYFSLDYFFTFMSYIKSKFKKSEPILEENITWGEKENIKLPTTGDEAISRLLSSEGKDAYGIIGVKYNASDEDIKKYYRKQAVLVHPDKNSKPGAETAFKILGQAFELIGSTTARRAYDAQMKDDEKQQAEKNFLDELKMKLIDNYANAIGCSNCGQTHKRVPTEKSKELARYCSACSNYHSASDGDVWAETSLLFKWHYYWCTDGEVYDITDYAKCNFSFMKYLKANSHIVQLKMGLKHPKHSTYNFDDYMRDLFGRAENTSNETNQHSQQHHNQSQEKQKKKKKGKRR